MDVAAGNSTSWNRSGTDVYLANINDQVGIGISTPFNKLQVIGDLNVTDRSGIFLANASGAFWNDINLSQEGKSGGAPDGTISGLVINGNSAIPTSTISGSEVIISEDKRLVEFGWSYSEGSLLADGFIFTVQDASNLNTTFLVSNATRNVQVLVNDPTSMIYNVTAFRITNNGMEVTATSSAIGAISSSSSSFQAPWSVNGANIYNDTASVGIGTSTPIGNLNVIGNGNFTGNLTVSDYLFFDADHYIKIGAPAPFDGIGTDTFMIRHLDSADTGDVAFAVTSQNRTLFATQVGRNSSASIMGNSFMVIPNNLDSNWTKTTDCFWVADNLSKTLRADCDTGGTGADLIIQDDIQAFGQGFFDSGIRSQGSATFVMEGNDFEVVNGSIHNSIPTTFTTGFVQGDEVIKLNEIFSGGLGDFVNQQTDTGNWIATTDALCSNGDCAVATGSGAGNVSMVNGVETSDVNETWLKFVYSNDNLAGSGDFEVFVNNNVGSGDVSVFSDSTTNVVTSSQEIELPSLTWDKANVTVKFNCFNNAGKPLRRCLVDEVILNGSAMTTAQIEVQGFDSEICFSDGTRDGDGICNVGIYFNASNNTVYPRGNWNLSGVGGAGISSHPLLSNLEWASAGHTFTSAGQDANFGNYNVTFGGNLSVNGSDLFVNSNTGKVGIGTLNATSRLVVNGTASPSADGYIAAFQRSGVQVQASNVIGSEADSAITVQSDGNAFITVFDTTNGVETFLGTAAGTDGFIGTATNNNFHIRTNNNEVVTFDTSGNVGIGTSTPVQSLNVIGGINATNLTIQGKSKFATGNVTFSDVLAKHSVLEVPSSTTINITGDFSAVVGYEFAPTIIGPSTPFISANIFNGAYTLRNKDGVDQAIGGSTTFIDQPEIWSYSADITSGGHIGFLSQPDFYTQGGGTSTTTYMKNFATGTGSTYNSSTTLNDRYHFIAEEGVNNGGVILRNYGFYAGNMTIANESINSFFSNQDVGDNTRAFFANGTAMSEFNGNVLINSDLNVSDGAGTFLANSSGAFWNDINLSATGAGGVDWGDVVNGTVLLADNQTLNGNYSASTDFCIEGGNCLSDAGGGGLNPLYMYFSSGGSVTATGHIGQGVECTTGTEEWCDILTNKAGSVSNLRCRRVSTAGTATIMVRHNNADSAFSCSMSSGTTCQDSTGTLNFLTTSVVNIKITESAAGITGAYACTLIWTPS